MKSLRETLSWKAKVWSDNGSTGMVGTDYIGRGKEISFVKNTISAPQDQSKGFATIEDMRENQVMLNRMREHRFLVAKGTGHTAEAYALQSRVGDCGMDVIREQEAVVEKMRADIKSERNTKDIYRWIRGKKGQGQFIVLLGGSAQMSDRMRVAQEA
eukprot:16445034-Heterocapsa_arctica.AAC.1